MKYKTFVLETPEGEVTLIQGADVNGNIWSIPTDPANSDYQAYLTQLEEETE
jgi:hypothetical protein